MKIAIIGTRGVPANYGGFETCAEELAVGLVQRGHEVWAYCRPGNAEGDPSTYKGVQLVYRGFLDSKVLGTFSHTFNCMRHAVGQGFDILMVFNAGNSPLAILPRLRGEKIAINVDGLEWRRAKWGPLPRLYYRLAEWVSAKVAHRVVADSRAIQDYYEETFDAPSTFIAYGAHVEGSSRPEILDQYGLAPDDYFFVASRLEPENNAQYTVAAFEKVETDKKLVVAGGANWESPFVREIKETKDPRIQFLGPVYTPGHIKELHCNCYAYVHGNEVGGTNPALLKALGYGNCVLALGVPFNAEVVQDAGILYEKDADDLAGKMRFVLENPDAVLRFREAAVRRVLEAYTWDQVVQGYERMFENILSGRYRGRKASD